MSENNIQEIGEIDDKYSIISEKNSGGFGTVYLVRDKKTNKEYAAKIINKDTSYKREVEINIKLQQSKIPNIVEYIDSNDNDIITLKDKEPEKKGYIIFKFYPEGDLLKYITLTGGLDERYSKVLFKKILETIQLIHSEKIYHFDLKLNNILLDDKYNPIICDFGLSRTINDSEDNKFYGSFGTRVCKPPQMHINQGFDGPKSDIFSLGVTLFKLITNHFPFGIAYSLNKFYKLIKNHEYDEYWKMLKDTKNIDVSESFKKLFVKMVDFEEDERPQIETILTYDWFNEINNLSDKEKENLENDYISEFNKKKDIMEQMNSTEDAKQKKPESLKGGIFTNEHNMNYVDNEKIFDNYIKIRGNLNPIDFMNDFAGAMEDLYDDIIINDKNFKFNLIKKKEDNDEENENGNNLEITEEIEKDLNIQVELFKGKNNEFILNFIKKEGDLNDYYKYLAKIISDARTFI